MTETLELYGKSRVEISSVPTGKAIQLAYDGGARDVILFANILISEFGRDRAGEIIREARYKGPYEEGRKTAEQLGNPKDLDSYISNYFYREPLKTMDEYFTGSAKAPFWVAPCQCAYRTEKRAVFRTSNYCFKAVAVKKFASEEMCRFIGDYYCIHDVAWANGFNPDMKYEMTKNFLWGDPYCEFTFEV